MLVFVGAISSLSLFAADLPGRPAPRSSIVPSPSAISNPPAANAAFQWWKGAGKPSGTTLPAPTNRFGILRFPKRGTGPSPGNQLAMNLPASGVYRAAPYSSIVVVPPAHLDDRCVVGRSAPQPRMPTVIPDLQFIPWKQK